MFSKQLVHLKHVSTVCLKNQSELLIANNFPLVTRILEIVFPYVSPQLLHNLNSTVKEKQKPKSFTYNKLTLTNNISG